MYAIVKTGGKQYKTAPGDYLNIEKIEGEAGDKVELTAITIVDGRAQVDASKCVFCGYCARACPQFCIKVV